MESYNHEQIEKKWQKKWDEEKLYLTQERADKKKCYVLDMFPYPSGEGLHVGHPKGYIATDIYSRHKRMSGFNVLHPMGWDAFGLPAENFALKNKVHPRVAVEKNIARFKEQLSGIGFSYDWEREINTTDPEYYKWTQWIFLKMFEQGLAYESHEPINWCPTCLTGLANEDLEGNECERCGTVVEKKPIRQWVLKITDYAERLLEDIESLDWPESIKESQRNWIGKSEGAEITFNIKHHDVGVRIFTTRPDTLYGATYIVLAPEHELMDKLKVEIKNWSAVEKYIQEASEKSDLDRQKNEKEKTGVLLEGVVAINPVNNEEVPVFVADYVLSGYGTGAIMAVPAHDERDFAFAKEKNLIIRGVVVPEGNVNPEDYELLLVSPTSKSVTEYILKYGPYTGTGYLIDSGEFNNQKSEDVKEKITKKVGGEMKTKYRLRDWVFSRQRYWGEPIPIIHCEKCGPVAVPEEDLPVVLPEVEHYEPTGTGESPLASIDSWVNTTCPTCNGAGKRETNTMPQWAGSSWYHLRYIDPKNSVEFADKEKEKYWSPVDMYVGGAEHATRHLIYARFWHKFLFDIKEVNYSEPFKRLQHVGLILAEDGRKMSKRYGNVVNPDDIVHFYGADTLRVYEMFMGPFAQSVSWNTESIIGPRKFLERVWRLQEIVVEGDDSLETILHKTIQKVGSDIENFAFNTAVSQLMIFLNEVEKNKKIRTSSYVAFLKLLAPFAPHIVEELWEKMGNTSSVHLEPWPEYDASKLISDTVSIPVQINGKVRGLIEADFDITEEEVLARIKKSATISRWIVGDIQKVIYVPNKLISLVI
ncbi:MAG: leucine--tRNA ligase [Candidatus Paceibacterota bacterium]